MEKSDEAGLALSVIVKHASVSGVHRVVPKDVISPYAMVWALINEPEVAVFGQASLIMRNLRTKRREDVGWGYTYQTAEAQRG
jgi:hypothetical protein